MKQFRIDFGKLILRLSVGGLMLFHGIHKLMYGHQGIKDLLASKELPEWLWIGVPIGEVLAPLLIIIGLLTRISSLLVAITMIFSIYIAFGMAGFNLGKTGAPIIELNLLYLFASIAIMCLGAGRYAVYKKENGILS